MTTSTVTSGSTTYTTPVTGTSTIVVTSVVTECPKCTKTKTPVPTTTAPVVPPEETTTYTTIYTTTTCPGMLSIGSRYV